MTEREKVTRYIDELNDEIKLIVKHLGEAATCFPFEYFEKDFGENYLASLNISEEYFVRTKGGEYIFEKIIQIYEAKKYLIKALEVIDEQEHQG